MDSAKEFDPRGIAPFSKEDARLVQIAAKVLSQISNGRRASEAIEAAMTGTHLVAVPIFRPDTETTELIITKNWRVPTQAQGTLRAIVEYVRAGGELQVSPERLITNAETWKLRQQMAGGKPRV